VYLLLLRLFRTHRYGLLLTVPCGTVTVKRKPRKFPHEAAEVQVVEELSGYVVEKSGSRRASVERREEILNIALSVLAERGYRGASMREIAQRAQASKETLYAWFGDKRGLFEELVRWQAERLEAVLVPSLERDADDPSEVLRGFAAELQRLLLGERAVVINRAAISEAPTDPTLAKVLATQGRGSILPELESYLEGQRERGRLDFEDAGTAVDVLIGLTIGDQQVRRLLGVLPMPEPEQIESRAEWAVGEFLTLFARR
jgi:AcrR family transcriptional regulator